MGVLAWIGNVELQEETGGQCSFGTSPHKSSQRSCIQFQVHINIEMLEHPTDADPKIPVPMVVNSCFDKLEISVNPALLHIMQSHLVRRELKDGDAGFDDRDTDFDRWIHGQVYQAEYNML